VSDHDLQHHADTDCLPHLDPETDTCAVCGAVRGDPCPHCGGEIYHQDGCSFLADAEGE